VLEEDLAARAHGVVGEFLAVHELFDADFRNVPQQGEDLVEIRGGIDAVSVGRSGARDGLDDDREPDPFRRIPYARDGRGAGVSWGADPSGIDLLLHPLLVPERDRLLDGHPGDPEHLADVSREQHVWLPEAFHQPERGVPGEPLQRAEHGRFVGERNPLIVREPFPGGRR
jgi:hypothetical protein